MSPISSPARVSFSRNLGGFKLEFLPSGRLSTLVLPGGVKPLFQAGSAFDLGDGKLFSPGGWDECFPTIEPRDGFPVMGELIWTAPVIRETREGIEQTWVCSSFIATRCFRLEAGGGLKVDFRAKNRSEKPLEFLWASHAIFSLDGLRRIEFPDGKVLGDFALNGTCSKFFVRSGEPVRLTLYNVGICLQTDQPWWGIWFNRGGWPAKNPGGFGCIGIEATTCDNDQPGGNLLLPGESFHGIATLEEQHDR